MGKSKSNPEIYILDFLTPGRVVINAKDFRKELLQIDILKLEELSGIVFFFFFSGTNKPKNRKWNQPKKIIIVKIGKIL